MRLPRRRRWQLSDDEGISLIEVMVACVVLSVAVLSVVGAMGSGMGLVGHSRQRTAGTGVAQERLERARNIAYEDLALNEDPTHSSVPGHPDGNVIENGSGPEDDEYRLSNGTEEPLIIDTTDGGLRHLDDPFTLAQTEFTVHQFVTWVDDSEVGDTEPTISGTQSYKRMIVVVTWKFPVHSGPRHTVVESTFVTDGTVSVPTPTPAGSASPTPSAPPGESGSLGVGTILTEGQWSGPLPSPAGAAGQCTGGSPQILSGTLLSGSPTHPGYVNSPSVQLRFTARDPNCTFISLFMANKTSAGACLDPAGYVEVQRFAAANEPPPITVTWTTTSGDGFKTFCAAAQDDDGHISQPWTMNVKLDQTAPTVPTGFAEATCTIDGNDRVATFSWNNNTSIDENLAGYHLYRSLETGAYELVARVSASPSPQDRSLKNYSSVRYFVRAFDKAGNESGDSVVVSYAKNNC